MTTDDILRIRRLKNDILENHMDIQECRHLIETTEKDLNDNFANLSPRDRYFYRETIKKLRNEKEVYRYSMKQAMINYLMMLSINE